MTGRPTSDSPSDYQPTNDWDIRIPEAVLHFGPVLIALAIAFLSLAGRSVFDGFEEEETGTHLSVLLMVSCGLIALAAARNPENPRRERQAALVLAVLIGVAIADEVGKYHEDIGKWVKRSTRGSLPPDIGFHADDLIILGAAIGGMLLLIWLRRRFPPDRALTPYFVAAVFTAIAHGVVDYLSHGTRVPRQLVPEMTKFNARALTDWLGVYEEAFKLWAEWFILLFLLRLLQRRDGRLGWAVMVMIGSLATLVGLWATGDTTPYVPIGSPFVVLRNPHTLFLYAALVIGWSVAVWMKFAERPRVCYMLGLGWLVLFGLPFLESGIAKSFGAAIYGVTHAFIPGEYYNAAISRWVVLVLTYILPGVAAGILGGLSWSRARPRTTVVAMGALTLALVLLAWGLSGVAAALSLMLPLCGFLVVIFLFYVRGEDRPLPGKALVASSALLVTLSFAATALTAEHLLPFRQVLRENRYFELGWARVKPWSLRGESSIPTRPAIRRR